MYIKGEFRDVLKRNGEVIENRAWKSNEIVPDFGNLLAAAMKKDFKDSSNNPIGIGIEYIAVGCGSNKKPEDFQKRVGEFFKNVKEKNLKPDTPEWNKFPANSDPNNWVWAKKIADSEIRYFDVNNGIVSTAVSNVLQIDITFDKNIPDSTESLKFEEFALLGYYDPDTNTNKEKIFFVNYAKHGTITKDKDMTLKRTIKLTFPINKFNYNNM